MIWKNILKTTKFKENIDRDSVILIFLKKVTIN